MGTGYTRQSSSSITSGQPIASAPVNNEFNQLAAAFSGTTGHAHDGTTGNGPALLSSSFGVSTSTQGILVAQGSAGAPAGSITTAVITGTSGQITVTNGNGAAGNPTITIDGTYAGQASITTLGTIATGTWHGAVVGGTYGGTGINNGANTITLGGNISTAGAFSTSGANSLTLTTTGGTNITLPTTGTLVTTSVTTLSSLTSVGTIGTGTWQATKIGLLYGGTNADLSASGGTSNVLVQASAGAAITVRQLAASDLSNGNTGSGQNVLANTPTLITPVLGVATATSINGLSITTTTGTLTITSGKTLSSANSLAFAGTDGTTITFQGTGTYVSRTSTDTLTNKTFDTAGAGNSFSINSTAITAVTGSGAVALATAPTISSANLTGTPAAPTAVAGTSTTQVATTAFVNSTALTLATGTTAVTQTASDSSTKVATTAFVNSKFSPATSWTPVLNINGSPTGITYTTQTGSYIQVGKFIIAELSIILSSKGVGTGNVTITGLPASANNTFGMANMNYYASLSGVANSVTGYIQNNVITPAFQTSSSQPVAITDTNLTNTSQLIMTCVYITT